MHILIYAVVFICFRTKTELGSPFLEVHTLLPARNLIRVVQSRKETLETNYSFFSPPLHPEFHLHNAALSTNKMSQHQGRQPEI